MTLGRLDERLEIARGVLLLAEDRPGDDAGGIVDGTDEREPRTTALEPVMATAVDLQEHARLAHAFTTAAVTARPSPSHRGQAGLGEDAAQGALGDVDVLALGEQVREMGPVHVRIRRRGQLDEPGPAFLVEPVRRDPAPVPMHERCGAIVTPVSRQQPSDGPDRESQVPGCLSRGQFAGQDMVEDVEPLLCSGVQRDRLPRLHGFEGDKVAGRLGLTDSLAVHTTLDKPLTDLTQEA